MVGGDDVESASMDSARKPARRHRTRQPVTTVAAVGALSDQFPEAARIEHGHLPRFGLSVMPSPLPVRSIQVARAACYAFVPRLGQTAALKLRHHIAQTKSRR